ncbi:MAG: helix-turn-helix domain-containing protein [Actinobacteria bacterium]|nr:helix-turn-helix domain-containing protein [Actinomycetota bacterium]
MEVGSIKHIAPRTDRGGTTLDPDVRMHRALADETRSRLLRILRASQEPLDARELAHQLGLHLTTVRAHLDVLVEAGLATSHSEDRTTPGRPRRLYEAADDPSTAVDAGGYRLLAEMLASHLAATSGDVASDAVAAGREWGTYLVQRPPPYTTTPSDAARAELLQLMGRLGFQAELDADGTRILLHRCPFLDVARRHQDVVCSLHLGILQGALRTLDAPLDARDLEPFVQPSLCVAHIAETDHAG